MSGMWKVSPDMLQGLKLFFFFLFFLSSKTETESMSRGGEGGAEGAAVKESCVFF